MDAQNLWSSTAGLEAARHIAKLGASKLIIAVRSVEKGNAAKQSIEESTHCDPSVIEVWQLDLCSYESVKAFASRATNTLDRLDVLLENAGVALERWDWAEDNEYMLTVNVVSTFLLAFLLLPKLKETANRFNTQPNLTVVTSEAHYMVDFEEKDAPEGIFNNLNDKTKANVPARYPTSKLMEIFVIREMATRRPAQSYPITFNLVNPGLCESELARESSLNVRILKFFLARPTEAGSRTLVNGAGAGHDTHGQYLNMCRVTQPATVVLKGEETQKRLFEELMAKLDNIEPGVSRNL